MSNVVLRDASTSKKGLPLEALDGDCSITQDCHHGVVEEELPQKYWREENGQRRHCSANQLFLLPLPADLRDRANVLHCNVNTLSIVVNVMINFRQTNQKTGLQSVQYSIIRSLICLFQCP